MFPSNIIDLISKISPVLGGALGGPIGASVGSLISSILGGVDMKDEDKIRDMLRDPENERRLKQLELEFEDIQNARIQENNDKGPYKLIRPFLAVVAMLAIAFDVYAIEHVTNPVVKDVLVIMLVILVYDIRQIYNFYFGKSEDLPDISILKRRR